MVAVTVTVTVTVGFEDKLVTIGALRWHRSFLVGSFLSVQRDARRVLYLFAWMRDGFFLSVKIKIKKEMHKCKS